MSNPMMEPTKNVDGGGVENEDEANDGRQLAEAGAAASSEPQDIPTQFPDQGDPELSAPPDGLSDTVAADESDA